MYHKIACQRATKSVQKLPNLVRNMCSADRDYCRISTIFAEFSIQPTSLGRTSRPAQLHTELTPAQSDPQYRRGPQGGTERREFGGPRVHTRAHAGGGGTERETTGTTICRLPAAGPHPHIQPGDWGHLSGLCMGTTCRPCAYTT